MQHGDGERRDPFEGLAEEPQTAPGSEVVPAVLSRRPKGRKKPLRPAERRRRGRVVAVTFSQENADVPERLRALAERWGMTTHTHKLNVSGLVEYLLLPRLEQAEKGKVTPPGWAG
jgi:hypothetical protein